MWIKSLYGYEKVVVVVGSYQINAYFDDNCFILSYGLKNGNTKDFQNAVLLKMDINNTIDDEGVSAFEIIVNKDNDKRKEEKGCFFCENDTWYSCIWCVGVMCYTQHHTIQKHHILSAFLKYLFNSGMENVKMFKKAIKQKRYAYDVLCDIISLEICTKFFDCFHNFAWRDNEELD